jgi:hypothetical protein
MPFRMAAPPSSPGQHPPADVIRHGRYDERAVARPQLDLFPPAVRARLIAADQTHLTKGGRPPSRWSS